MSNVPVSVERINPKLIANKGEVAAWFGETVPVINHWIEKGCPVIQQGDYGRPWKFNLYDVAKWYWTELQPMREVMRYGDGNTGGARTIIDPENLSDPSERRAWYGGEKLRIEIEQKMRILVSIHEYNDELSRIVKELAEFLETLPDELGQSCPLPPETIEELQAAIDNQRGMLLERLKNG